MCVYLDLSICFLSPLFSDLRDLSSDVAPRTNPCRGVGFTTGWAEMIPAPMDPIWRSASWTTTGRYLEETSVRNNLILKSRESYTTELKARGPEIPRGTVKWGNHSISDNTFIVLYSENWTICSKGWHYHIISHHITSIHLDACMYSHPLPVSLTQSTHSKATLYIWKSARQHSPIFITH